MEKTSQENISLTENDVVAVTSLMNHTEKQVAASSSDLSGTPTMQSIEAFLAKPRLIHTYTVTSTSEASFAPAMDYLLTTAVLHRTQYFKRLTGNVKVTMEVTAPVYAVGMLIASVHYGNVQFTYPFWDDTTHRIFRFSQNHVLMDLGTQMSSSLKIPLSIDQPFVDISNLTLSNPIAAPVIYLRAITPLTDVSDGTPAEVSVRVYVSIEDAQVTVPVHTGVNASYTSKDAETWETASGPISYPATIIANAGKALAKVPIIGKFAYATSLIASGIGKMAVIFGFSRPKNESDIPYQHIEDYSSYVGNLRVKTFTLDPLQEIPLDAPFYGSSEDNLSFASIIGREGIVRPPTTFSTSLFNQTKIFEVAVNPTYCHRQVDVGWNFTPLAYGSIMFTAWRGSLVYKLYVPANRFVRGKLRVAYIPQSYAYTTSYEDLTQNCLSVVLDLSQSSSVELSVPYTHINTYLPIVRPNNNLITDSNYNNGFVAVFVEQQLKIPASTGGVSIFLTVRAGDDFELQIPQNEGIQYCKTILETEMEEDFEWTPALKTNPVPPTTGLNPQFETVNLWATYTMEDTPLEPTLQTTVNLIDTVKTPEMRIWQMGEVFNSFRPLLKRFNKTEHIDLAIVDTDRYGAIDYVVLAFPTSGPILNTTPSIKKIFPQRMSSPMSHLSRLFTGYRGSTRLMYLPTAQATQQAEVGFEREQQQVISTYRSIGIGNTFKVWEQIPYASKGLGYDDSCVSYGGASFFKNSETVLAEYPHQQLKLITPVHPDVQVIYVDASTVPQEKVFIVRFYNLGQDKMYYVGDLYHAIGEDFNFHLWNGVPPCSMGVNKIPTLPP